VVTTELLPGYVVHRVCGQVLGVAARSRNPYREGVKTLTGSADPAARRTLAGWRHDAIEDMTANASRLGANAVIGMRFDHREITQSWSEICAYGTAVVVSATAGHHGLDGTASSRPVRGVGC
jgi:uncharacterized protein YbjQ (UPF0145 family)